MGTDDSVGPAMLQALEYSGEQLDDRPCSHGADIPVGETDTEELHIHTHTMYGNAMRKNKAEKRGIESDRTGTGTFE